MKSIKWVVRLLCRYALGATFVFSGFVKAVDPYGSAYKFQDYFTAFGMDWLNGLALFFAIMLAAIELSLGVLLILDELRPIAVWGTAGLMFIFTPLTLYLAIANPVDDCGCFGDALKLSNWATFWKNIVLLLLTLPLLLGSWKKRGYKMEHGRWKQYAFAGVLFLLTLFPSIYALRHLPLLDFRPYHVGASLIDGRLTPEGAQQPVYETTFIYEKDGEQRQFTEADYPWDDTTWSFVSSDTKLVVEGYIPPLRDFRLYNAQGDEITDAVLAHTHYLALAVSPFLEDIDDEESKQLDRLRKSFHRQGYPFYLATSSSPQAAQDYLSKKDSVSIIFGDERVLKTIVRANPGVVLAYRGVIIAKWNANDIPPRQQLRGNILSSILTSSKNARAVRWAWGVAFALIAMRVALLLYRQRGGNFDALASVKKLVEEDEKDAEE